MGSHKLPLQSGPPGSFLDESLDLVLKRLNLPLGDEPMLYRFLADVLVALHLAFVVFVAVGGLLVLWRRKLAFLHVPAALWGVLIELAGWVCPLTPLEVHFRRLGGQGGYEGGFVEHYLVPVLYPSGLGRGHQIMLGVLVGLVNLGVYGLVIWRFRSKGRERGVR